MTDINAYDAAPEGEFRDYVALLKPRVMSLVVFTAFVGLFVAPVDVHPFIAFCSVLFIALGGGASGALNMWYDRDIDAIMNRTQSRPIPSGRVEHSAALGLGLVLSIISVMMLGLVANWFAAGFLAFTIFFYAVVYTVWLKRWTPQNIVIGGAAGAFPPMIGWACATGGISIESLLMFALVFFWTPPHFWALALFVKTDYANAGIPMLPVVKGERTTRRQILLYSIILLPAALAPWWVGGAGMVYGVTALVLSLLFVALAVPVGLRESAVDDSMTPEKRLFKFSILYLFLLFAILVVDRMLANSGVIA